MVEICIISGRAPVAQMDRAIASGAIGREFESLRAHQILLFSQSLLDPPALLASWKSGVE